MGDVIIEGCPLCKGNGKPYQQTHTQCFDGSLLISTGCSKCGLNILGKGDDSRQKWNSIDRPKHLEQRLAELEEAIANHCEEACISAKGKEKQVQWFIETNKR